MRPSTALRLLAVVVIGLALVASGCNRGQEEAEETATPEATEGVERSDEFQLVGRAEQAFLGATPEVDITGDLTLPPAVQGTVTAPEAGVIRVLLSDLSASLRDRCQADADDRIEVFWTEETRFDPILLRGDIEETLDGRTIGAIGTIFIAPGAPGGETDEDLFGSPAVTGSPAVGTSPAADSPGATPLDTGEINENCVLIADQLGTSGALPTARPRATATPTPTLTPSPTPSPTPTATTPPTTEPPETTPPETSPPAP